MSLSANTIAVSRRTREILSDVSLDLLSGSVVALLGANGAGKSTLLGALANELSYQRGQVTLDGTELADVGHHGLARRRAVLPQHSSLSFDMPVDQVVAMGAYPFPEVEPVVVESEIRRALACVECEGFLGRRYGELSGGEQQRVQSARVLLQCLVGRTAGDARYLMLDEPTASLDPRHQQGLLRAVTQLAATERLGVLAILHDVNLAARWCDRIALLAQGRLIACGSPAEVLTEANLAEVYDMPVRVLPHPLAPERPLVCFDLD